MITDRQDFETQGAACRVYLHAPRWNGLRTAAIGDFRCADAGSGAALLSRVEETLRAEGVEAVIGPMNGDTWHSYRLVIESDGSPPFALEPVSGPHDEEAFAARGFAPVCTYASTRTALSDVAGNMAAADLDGVTVSPWDGGNAEELLEGLFDISSARFSGNPFYKPISRDAFLALYEPLLPAVDPRLVFFARDGGRMAGFLFGMPDMAEGPRPRTAIVKTYASQRSGLGRLLLDAFHRTALDLGFTDAIHALMHEGNASLESSRRYGARVFRRYALMGKRLSE